jgi:polar amino acid transport system substrate-binding protein
MKRQALSFFIIVAVFIAYYFIKHMRFNDQKVIEQNTVSLIVGTNAEYKPFSFIDQNGAIAGFDIDVMNAIAHRLGITVVYKDLPFEALMGELHNGTIDCMIGGINPTPERAQKVLFSENIYEHDPLVIVYQKENTPLRSIADLAFTKVLVNEGYFADSFLSNQKDIILIRLSSNLPSDGLLALQNGQAQAFVGSKSTTLQVLNATQKNLFTYVIIDDVVEADAFAIAKTNVPLFNDMNKAIQELKKDNTLNSLVQKWFQDIL